MENRSNSSIYSLNDYDKCIFTNQILLRYFGTFIFFIGIFSTLLSIWVFTRKPLRRKSCCFYFLILAISDSIHLTTMTIEHLPYSFHIDLIIIHSWICKIVIFMIYLSNHLSNIVLTLASIDRFILIYYPLQSKRFCKINKAKWLVIFVLLILLLSNGHILYGYEKLSINSDGFHHFYDCNIRHDNIIYKEFFHFYDSYIESICFVLIPFLLMSLCSILIIIKINESRKTIAYHARPIPPSHLRDRDRQLCCMLIGTSFAFLLLCLPAEINDISNYSTQERSCFHWFRKVILMLMQQIYYAGHFYIYTLTGQIFRKHLYAIIFKHHRQNYIHQQRTEYRLSMRIKTNRRSTTITTSDQSRRTTHERLNKTFCVNDTSQRLHSDPKVIFSS